jgi:hypothetical protein
MSARDIKDVTAKFRDGIREIKQGIGDKTI